MKSLVLHRLLPALFLCCAACLSVHAGDAEGRFRRFLENIATFENNFTQEKVYLHLDNNGYFPGDKIWFKAYVLRASSLLPTSLSGVLYVDLLTPDGTVWQHQSLPIENGRTYGDFTLDGPVPTGFYEVRAYTRAMTNWDQGYMFSRVIPVFDAPEDTLNFTDLLLPQRNPDNRMVVARPLTAVSDKEGALPELTFYPEGGHLVKGQACRVAYRMTAGGMPANERMRLCRNDGSIVLITSPLHEGMGSFVLPADWSGGYLELAGDGQGGGVKRLGSALPQPQERGCALTVDAFDSDSDVVISMATAGLSETLGMSVMRRGKVEYFDTLQAGRGVVKRVPKGQLRGGVNQVTVFTDRGEVLAERLFWVAPHDGMTLRIGQNEPAYGPYAPVVMDFTLRDGQGQPVQGEFSLSVRDGGAMTASDGTGIQTEMLLASDLRGYVHRPEYYFEKGYDRHEALDLLLMVQGWRRYEWTQMAGVAPFRLKQPAEMKQLIAGRVIDWKPKKKQEGTQPLVNLVLYGSANLLTGTAQVDSLGYFAMELKRPLYDDILGAFTVTNEKYRRQRANVALFRHFAPAPRAYDLREMMLESPEAVRRQATARRPELFHWVDTLPNVRMLPEARKDGVRRVPDAGSRFTWLGGESYGQRYASLYYNLENELETYLDKGELEPYLWDWLKEVNPYFEYQPGGGDFLYKRRPVHIICDNAEPIAPYEYEMHEFKTLIISEDYELKRGFNSSSYVRPPVTFFLYSNPGSQTWNQAGKGYRYTLIHGFSRPDEFFSPDYRTMDAINPADLRRTLYWNPNVVTNAEGQANVLFFNNARQGTRLNVNAQGIAVNGELFGTR